MYYLIFLGETPFEDELRFSLLDEKYQFDSKEAAKIKFFQVMCEIFACFDDDVQHSYQPTSLKDIDISWDRHHYKITILVLEHQLIVEPLPSKESKLKKNKYTEFKKSKYTELFYGTSGGLRLGFSALIINSDKINKIVL